MSEPSFEVLVGANPLTGALPEPTAAWVQGQLQAYGDDRYLQIGAEVDIQDTVIAAAIADPDTDTRAELDPMFAGKADLDGGVVPDTQLPTRLSDPSLHGTYATTPARAFPLATWIAVGDSLVESVGTDWPASLLGPAIGVTITNSGVSGTSVADMLLKAGALEPRITLTADTIVATTTAVTVTAIDPATGWRINGSGTFSWTGTLAGVPGTLTHNLVTDVWTFTRTTAGSAVSCPAGTRFIRSRSTSSAIVLVGRNNVGVDLNDAMDQLRSLVRSVSDASVKRVLVLGILNQRATSESIGRKTYNAVTSQNTRNAAVFGENFLDWRRKFIDNGLTIAGITAAGTDTADIAADTPPASLMTDTIHPNAAGYGVLTYLVAYKLMDLGWVARQAVHGGVITSDTFTRADGSLGSTNAANGGAAKAWTVDSQIAIVSNKMGAATLTNQRHAYLTAGVVDAAVQCKLANATTLTYTGLLVRMTDTSNYYTLDIASDGSSGIYKRVAGTLTALATSTGTFVIGDTARIEAVGTTLRAYRNGALIAEIVDASITTGSLAGIKSPASGAGNWFVDDILMERLGLN